MFIFQSKNCNLFRWRDKEEVNPKSKFILPKLVNNIKEVEDEVWSDCGFEEEESRFVALRKKNEFAKEENEEEKERF